jgi:stage V sporulation protein G
MEITEVKVRLWNDQRLRALVTVVFEDCFVVRNIKVIEGRDNKLFVAMPSRRMPDGRYGDIAHPITRAFRQKMETTIIGAYLKEVERSGEMAGEPNSQGRRAGDRFEEGEDDSEMDSSRTGEWYSSS